MRAGLGVTQLITHSPRALQWRWATAIGLLFALAAGLIAYVTMKVPVSNLAEAPVIGSGSIGIYWPVALAGLIVVVAVDAVLVGVGARGSKERERPRTPPSPIAIHAPRWALVATGIVSALLLAGTIYLRLPLWQKAFWALIPWLPLFILEEVWKYRQYGFYAAFLALAVLQVGHLGEHSAQVLQLVMSGGDLTRSHGVFGQLDFEMVHFVWDTAVWLGGGILVYKFWDNKWIWFSWIVASVHQVEHIYLFWINQFHMDFWARGGIFGIFGEGGLIGSPLPRPYLHFGYNFLVVVPMLIGMWNETRRAAAAQALGQDSSSSIPS